MRRARVGIRLVPEPGATHSTLLRRSPQPASLPLPPHEARHLWSDAGDPGSEARGLPRDRCRLPRAARLSPRHRGVSTWPLRLSPRLRGLLETGRGFPPRGGGGSPDEARRPPRARSLPGSPWTAHERRQTARLGTGMTRRALQAARLARRKVEKGKVRPSVPSEKAWVARRRAQGRRRAGSVRSWSA
jgi:hypothetical protein